MKTPTEFQLENLTHFMPGYDPQKAHEYYLRTRQLKGRKKSTQPLPTSGRTSGKQLPAHRRPKGEISPKVQQKAHLQANITNLQAKLVNLKAMIAKKEAVLQKDQQLAKSRANQNQKGKAKGPKTAAQKAAQAQKAKQKTQAKKAAGGSGGGKGTKGVKGAKGVKGQANTPISQQSIAQLKALATRVEGLLAVAKQKLAAL